ncbi:MAG: outer-membrane lipoprotein carrier protein LolA [Henriciella sp.]|nr:outer-membrane lipoprotein carrier protein LolA [Henriciella sp.]
MIATMMTALTVIFVLGQQVPLTLQAVPLPATDEGVTVPVDTLIEDTVPVIVGQPIKTVPAAIVTEDVSTPVAETETPEPAIITEAEVTEATPVEATPAPQPALSDAARSDILNGVKTALSNARTAKGQFTQSNSDGSLMTGDFALRRPGKMRFDYHDPTPILIVSDGTTVAMQDSELETVDRIPLGSTPLGLILDDDLEFSGDVEVLRVSQGEDKVWITLRDATGEVEGELTMIFATGSYDLLGWLTMDADYQMTTVELSEVETNGRIDPRLFRLDEAEDEEDER